MGTETESSVIGTVGTETELTAAKYPPAVTEPHLKKNLVGDEMLSVRIKEPVKGISSVNKAVKISPKTSNKGYESCPAGDEVSCKMPVGGETTTSRH